MKGIYRCVYLFLAPHSKPLQMVRGFLGSELFRLEDIIGNLNKKIDIIGDRVTKRPNQLARASLMAGMTSTFGDLQNTIELLNKKLDRRLDPDHAGIMMSSDPREYLIKCVHQQSSHRLSNRL